MMKKISILSLHLGYGGIEKSIVNLANTLCKRYEVEIACCYKMYDKSVFDLNDKVKIKFHLKVDSGMNRFGLKDMSLSLSISFPG